MSFAKKFRKGKKKKAAEPTFEKAIQQFQVVEGNLARKRDYFKKKINQEIKTAKEKGPTDKRAALNALKRKKQLEKQLQEVESLLTTAENEREAVENAKTKSEILKIKDCAAKALKLEPQPLGVGQVHDDISKKTVELNNEIDEDISSSTQFDTFDEDELLAELEELEQEELDEKLLDVGPPVMDRLPEVPSDVPVQPQKSKKVEDEDDMAELAAWAS